MIEELLALQEVVAGRYSIERELGRGGMGIVFLARDVALERPVAIKLLPPFLASDERMRERFVREARTAARLSHPNIVPIHSVEEREGAVFFVMGFVDGETLTARVRRAGPLDARDAGRLVQELAWALAYAHTAGVIHRDVKPDNVLIERATGRAMLTDFGIAHRADRATSTEPGEIVGTAQFVSPEQASGAPVDGRSDLYSLGVTAFYALTGRLPFQAPTVMGLLGMHMTQPSPPIATVRASLPPKLAAAVDRCLAKDPADRFMSGEQLADAIAEARGTEVQIAPAVRVFLRDRTRMGYELGMLYLVLVYVGAFTHLPFLRIAAPLSLLGAASVIRLFQTARRLLRAGHGFDDVRMALEAEEEARREEAGFSGSADDRRRNPLFVASTWVSAGIVVARRRNAALSRHERQVRLSRWYDRLWHGRLGKWFFALAALPDRTIQDRLRARLGLRPAPAVKAPPAADASAPTEVFLAQAAEDLLEALSPPTRAQLGAGRNVIERLRAQIAALREREVQLEAAIAQAGAQHALTPAPGVAAVSQTLVERHAALTNELDQARRNAAARRASAVAALENIRLQLLRLQSGIGSPADLTADLDAAREVERQISAIVEANELAP